MSLKVGGNDVPYSIDEREPASERLSASARARYAFKDCSSWGLLSKLVGLDISLVDDTDEEMLRRLFDCFQDPNCPLRELSFSVCHIRVLIEKVSTESLV